MPNVSIRQKLLAKQRISLYLDLYPPLPHPVTGKLSRREFLRLYLFQNPQSPQERRHNKETLARAEAVRAQRQVQLQQYFHHSSLPTTSAQTDFLLFFQQRVEESDVQHSRVHACNSRWVLTKLTEFSGGSLPLYRLNKQFCEAFKEFVCQSIASGKATRLAPNTANMYLSIFRATLRAAYEAELLPENLSKKFRNAPAERSQRAFLTLEELKSLSKTPFSLTPLRKAAFFSAFTGLRYGDIRSLRWEHVSESKALGPHLHFRQGKTGEETTLPLSPPACDLLGARQAAAQPLFAGLKDRIHSWDHGKLRAWVRRAGIAKYITFHCFRHTFATLHLTIGTDLYTVSKLLGHRSVQTTQIYGRIVDEKKKVAVDLLDAAWRTGQLPSHST